MDQRQRLVEQVLAAHQQTSRLLLGTDLSGLFDADLTMPQLKVLVLLHREGAMSGHQLADQLAVSTPTVSGMVDRLVDRGMLTRRADERDRRVRLVALSESGAQVVASVHEAGWQFGRDLMDRMELEDLQALAQGLQAFTRAARARQDERSRT
ncbi:MarR family transcriptional regulator [Ruania albidiflava]|uniref:MarR family transcriptional regulator n=1 Tax=Ruania albidiflava TaxID=366586 RepID=UPI0023F17943|nr:MarR family transcriptional regulator [Ruania albidiflava]